MPEITQDIFKIEKFEHNARLIMADVLINSASAVFEGHFPGQPVVPGACMLQLVKDILESALQTALLLKKAGSLKFVSMLTPQNNPAAVLKVDYKIMDEGVFSVNARLISGGIVCFKFSGEFVKL